MLVPTRRRIAFAVCCVAILAARPAVADVQQFLGRTIAWDAELDRKVAALTPAAVKAALERHLIPAKISIIKAGDFAKAAK